MKVKANKPYSKILNEVIKTAAIFDLLALIILIFIANNILLSFVGILGGSMAGTYKLMTTFKGVSNTTEANGMVSILVNNIIGYLLLIAILIVGAIVGTDMFIGVMIGIFDLYFAIFVYNIYIGIRSRRKRKNDDQ